MSLTVARPPLSGETSTALDERQLADVATLVCNTMSLGSYGWRWIAFLGDEP